MVYEGRTAEFSVRRLVEKFKGLVSILSEYRILPSLYRLITEVLASKKNFIKVFASSKLKFRTDLKEYVDVYFMKDISDIHKQVKMLYAHYLSSYPISFKYLIIVDVRYYVMLCELQYYKAYRMLNDILAILSYLSRVMDLAPIIMSSIPLMYIVGDVHSSLLRGLLARWSKQILKVVDLRGENVKIFLDKSML